MTPALMASSVLGHSVGWRFDVVSIGYPGPVVHDKPIAEPHNLAPGWVGLDFESAFKHPVRMVNDAAMRALGRYNGGRILFIGLGTGMGSAMNVHGEMVPMELGHLTYRKGRTFEDYVGGASLAAVQRRRVR